MHAPDVPIGNLVIRRRTAQLVCALRNKLASPDCPYSCREGNLKPRSRGIANWEGRSSLSVAPPPLRGHPSHPRTDAQTHTQKPQQRTGKQRSHTTKRRVLPSPALLERLAHPDLDRRRSWRKLSHPSLSRDTNPFFGAPLSSLRLRGLSLDHNGDHQVRHPWRVGWTEAAGTCARTKSCIAVALPSFAMPTYGFAAASIIQVRTRA